MSLFPQLLVCWLLLLASPASDRAPVLIDFVLADARGGSVARADVAGRPVLIIAAGRAGRESSRVWGAALRERLAEELAAGELLTLRVADLRGVPGMLRKRVTKSIARDETSRVLLDWEGAFARVYGLDPGRVHLLVFDRDGSLRQRLEADELDPPRLERLVATLRGL